MTYNPDADPRRTERVMMDMQQPDVDRTLEGVRSIGGGRFAALADSTEQRLGQQRQGLQPLGNPFGFGGGR
jgi:hypothetical protein